MNPGDILQPGTAFGSYEIVRLIGRGAFGSVYEAIKMPLRRRVALKVLLSNYVSDNKIVGRFLREAEAAAGLRHPHIVETFDVDVQDGLPFIAMEFLEGESLKARLDRSRTLDVTTAVDVLLPVLSAMALVHEQGIVHRDLKPDNLFLENRLGAVHPKVLDFGIAKADDNRNLSVLGSKMGSPLYMSPEQHEGQTVDHRTDLWSLGVILFQCLTGKVPFPGNTLPQVYRGVTTEPTPTLRLFNPSIPAQVEAVVFRALAKQPSQRWSSAREMGAALLPFASPVLQHTLQQEFPAAAAMHASMDSATIVAGPPSGAMATDSTMFSSHPSVPSFSGPAVAPLYASHPPATMLASQPGLPPGARPSSPNGAAPYSMGPSNPAFQAQSTPNYLGSSTFESGELSPRDTVPKRSLLPALAGGIFVLGLFVGGLALLNRGRSTPTEAATTLAATTRPISVEAVPATAAIQLDDEPAVVGRLSRTLPDDGRPHSLRLSAVGYVPQTVTFLAASPPPSRIVLSPLGPTAVAPAAVPAAVRRVAPVVAPVGTTPTRTPLHRGVRRRRPRGEVGNL